MAGQGDDELDRPLVQRATPLDKVPDDPPVVSRLMIEIRADGTRSIVRGRMEDHTSGEPQVVEMEARAATPVELVKTLTRALVDVLKGGPTSLGSVVRGLLPGGRKKPE